MNIAKFYEDDGTNATRQKRDCPGENGTNGQPRLFALFVLYASNVCNIDVCMWCVSVLMFGILM